MREFFKGWRRKVGCITLVMACLFMVLWMRSLTIHEGVRYRTGQESDLRLISFESAINCCWLDGSPSLDQSLSFNWLSSPHSPDLMVNNPNRSWRWRVAGFGIHDCTYYANATFIVLLIPYWSIVLPLNLISGYLLLVKPRPAAQPKSTQAAATTGT